jgi:hypothetical protein
VLPRILRTASFRLAAAYTGLFAASVLVLGVFVSWTTRSALEQQMDARIEAEVTALRQEFRSGGVDGLLRTVRERSRGALALDYAVADPSGNRLAGELPPQHDQTGWTEVEVYSEDPGERGELEKIRMLSTRLDDGTWFAVGDDIDEPMHAITAALSWALGLTVALGIAGGWCSAAVSCAGSMPSRVPRRPSWTGISGSAFRAGERRMTSTVSPTRSTACWTGLRS